MITEISNTQFKVAFNNPTNMNLLYKEIKHT